MPKIRFAITPFSPTVVDEVRFLVRYLRRTPFVYPLLVIAVTLSIAVTIVEALGLFAIVPILQSIGSQPLGTETKYFAPILNLMTSASGEVNIKRVALFLLAVALTKPLLSFCSSILSNVVPIRLRVAIFTDIVHLQLRAALTAINKEDMGRWSTLYVTFIDQLAGLVSMMIGSVTHLFLLCLYTTLMWIVSPKAVFLSGAVIIAIWILTRWLVKTQVRMGRHITEARARLQQSCLQMLSTMRLIRVVAGEKRAAGAIFEKLHRYISYYYKVIVVASLTAPITALVSGILVASLLYFGDILFTGSQADWLGSLIIFVVVFYRLLTPAQALNGTRIGIAQMWPVLREVKRLVEICENAQIKDGTLDFADYPGDIEIRNVSFHFGNEPVLKGINLTIPAGTMIALVGPSGAGKSTLVSLLMRLYDPTEGRIFIGGNDSRDYRLETLCHQIGFVSQDILLFNDTVRNNFKFVKPDATDGEIWAALELAEASGFVAAMEEGLDTRLQEGGQRLSGGQRQRISLARALLSPKRVLILDEATNQLDSFTEAAIQRTIEQLRGQCTLIVIAHRMATIQRADTIVVLRDGEIVECGSHRELMKMESLYSQMIQHQHVAVD